MATTIKNTSVALEMRKEAALLEALDHGVTSGRAAAGVFARVRSGVSGARQKKRRASR